jgi:glutathione S-transferase
MHLFDNPLSPYALKVRISLYEKGLNFECHEILRHGDLESLLKLNKRGEVPALKDGDTVVVDSRVICEYLDERYPDPPLLPADAGDRASARAIELMADTKLDAVIIILGLLKVFRPQLGEEHPEIVEGAKQLLAEHCAVLNGMLTGREYFCGNFSAAALQAWYRRMGARPSVQRAMLESVTSFENSGGITDPFLSNDRLHWRSDRIESLMRFGLGNWLVAELEAGTGFLPPAL